jgi:hypothetical protein
VAGEDACVKFRGGWKLNKNKKVRLERSGSARKRAQRVGERMDGGEKDLKDKKDAAPFSI